MTGHLYSAIYILTLCIGCASVLLVIVNTMGMLFQVRPERETLSHFVAPFLPLLPRMLTEAGVRCRRRFWLYLALAACCVGALVTMERSYGKPPYMEKLNAQSNNVLHATREDARA
jgi:type II secretory pathway component PulF